MTLLDSIQHKQLPLIKRGVEVLTEELDRHAERALATERELQSVVDLINKTLNSHIIAPSVERIMEVEADRTRKKEVLM